MQQLKKLIRGFLVWPWRMQFAKAHSGPQVAGRCRDYGSP